MAAETETEVDQHVLQIRLREIGFVDAEVRDHPIRDPYWVRVNGADITAFDHPSYALRPSKEVIGGQRQMEKYQVRPGNPSMSVQERVWELVRTQKHQFRSQDGVHWEPVEVSRES